MKFLLPLVLLILTGCSDCMWDKKDIEDISTPWSIPADEGQP